MQKFLTYSLVHLSSIWDKGKVWGGGGGGIYKLKIVTKVFIGVHLAPIIGHLHFCWVGQIENKANSAALYWKNSMKWNITSELI